MTLANELNLATRKTLVASLPHGGVVAEIGVAGGQFSETIWELNEPRQLWLIDCWEYQPKEVYGDDPSNAPDEVQLGLYRHVQERFADRPTVHFVRAYSVAAAQRFEDEYFDWLHFDANHRQVRQDLEAWYSKVKQGGWYTGHDYTIAGDFITVKTDVDLFVAEHGLELFVTRGDDGDIYEINYPSWAFRKP